MKRIFYKVNGYIDFREYALPKNSIWTSDELIYDFELTKNDILAMVDMNLLIPIKIDPNKAYWFFGARFIDEEDI